MNKFGSVISYFLLQQWRFRNNNFLRLMDKLNPADRSEFDLDIGSLDWKEYFGYYIRGIRVYLMNDPLTTVPQGRAKFAKYDLFYYVLNLFALCIYMSHQNECSFQSCVLHA